MGDREEFVVQGCGDVGLGQHGGGHACVVGALHRLAQVAFAAPVQGEGGDLDDGVVADGHHPPRAAAHPPSSPQHGASW